MDELSISRHVLTEFSVSGMEKSMELAVVMSMSFNLKPLSAFNASVSADPKEEAQSEKDTYLDVATLSPISTHLLVFGLSFTASTAAGVLNESFHFWYQNGYRWISDVRYRCLSPDRAPGWPRRGPEFQKVFRNRPKY